MSQFTITAFYKFLAIENVSDMQTIIQTIGAELELQGLVLVATEGVNGTIAGSSEGIATFKEKIQAHIGPVVFKDSLALEAPFKRWFVKVRPEIVAIGDPNLYPETEDNNHITPEEWDKMMEEKDIVVLDTRNTYETMIGTFENAIDPNLEKFDQFADYVAKCDIPKDKKVLMFCTGGIRCEKASLEMQRQGYQHVYQLKGGILQYLQERPHSKFKGECFVFDHRGAVDQELNPSARYKMCPHCGDPGDLEISCAFCQEHKKICTKCSTDALKNTCSKDCRERLRRKQIKTGGVAK